MHTAPHFQFPLAVGREEEPVGADREKDGRSFGSLSKRQNRRANERLGIERNINRPAARHATPTAQDNDQPITRHFQTDDGRDGMDVLHEA